MMHILVTSIMMIIFVLAVTTHASASQVIPGYLDITSALKRGSAFVMTLDGNVNTVPVRQADGTIIFWAWKIPIEGNESLRVVAVMLHDGVNSQTIEGYHPHIAKFDSNSCIVEIINLSSDSVYKENMVVVALNESYENFAMTGLIGPRSDCITTGMGITLEADHT